VHLAHLKALGRDVWGKSGDIVGLVAAARERGVAVTADQYPWRASGTRFGNALIPRWAMADSDEAMFARLENPDLADGIREEMEQNLWRRGGSDSLLVTGESQWRGMTLEEIAAQMDVDPIDGVLQHETRRRARHRRAALGHDRLGRLDRASAQVREFPESIPGFRARRRSAVHDRAIRASQRRSCRRHVFPL
jgi:N-acyl-D-aspartate/D-glutamate deacylase